MRKIPFAGVELTSQRVRGLRGTSELPGRPAPQGKLGKFHRPRWRLAIHSHKRGSPWVNPHPTHELMSFPLSATVSI